MEISKKSKVVSDYNKDQILRGMIVENITQRDNEFLEEKENIMTVKNYLIADKILLDENGKICPPVGHISTTKPFEFGSVRQICLWLDKNVLRGMIIENLTQRTNNFMELNENIVAIESYINSHKDILNALRDSRSAPKKDTLGRTNIGSLGKNEYKEKATSSDISFWIDKKTEEVISD